MKIVVEVEKVEKTDMKEIVMKVVEKNQIEKNKFDEEVKLGEAKIWTNQRMKVQKT